MEKSKNCKIKSINYLGGHKLPYIVILTSIKLNYNLCNLNLAVFLPCCVFVMADYSSRTVSLCLQLKINPSGCMLRKDKRAK